MASLPTKLRSFHLPSRLGAYSAGSLEVTGLARLLFPPSPVRTVVRTLPTEDGGVAWLRSFAGSVWLQSTYSHSPSTAADIDALHDVESVFPLDFRFDWTAAVGVCPESGLARVAPPHLSTTLLGIVPVPTSLVSVGLQMDMHADGEGWDLTADVRALGGQLQLVCYRGPMRRLAEPGPEEAEYVPGFHHLVLFDGVCNLCNASVDFLLRFDHDRRLAFCAQQQPAAVAALRAAGHADALAFSGGDGDSVLVLTPDGRLHERSAAALAAGAALGWPWRGLALVGMLVPSRLLNVVYDWVGANRYRWFGKGDTCRLPTPDERRRFLRDGDVSAPG